MASDLNFVQFIMEQLAELGDISYRKMFGEYAIYYGGKVVALVCDNQLFVKPTVSGRDFASNVIEAPPYPGAKPAFLIEEQLEDKEWLCRLIRLTERELLPPKTKENRKRPDRI